MNTPKIIIISFTVIVFIFLLVIWQLFKLNNQSFYQSSINEKVKEVYIVRGRPTQRSAKLNNDIVIDVPSEFIPYIQKGDSIIKESNSNFMMLITFKLNSRTLIIHP